MVDRPSPDSEIVRLINVLRADEGDSVEILSDNPDFNGQPNCAIVCCGDWTGWLHKRFAADTLLDALSMAMVEKSLPSPRKVIATSNGHHWIERFNLVCCRDCGFVRRADDQNAPCKGPVGVGIRHDLLPPHITTQAATPAEQIVGEVQALQREIIDRQAEIQRLRDAAQSKPEPDDWQDDPSADERWNAGLDFGMVQLCAVLGVDPHMVNWDAATETLDGDVCAAIGNIFRTKYGEDFDPTASSLPSTEGKS